MSEIRSVRAYAGVVLGRQRSPEYDTGPWMTPYLRAANVKDGVLDLSDVKEMNFDPPERARYSLQCGDILVTEGSGSLSAVGASAVWSEELQEPICFQNTLLRLRPRSGTDGRFLAWWCRYAFADGLFASVATGANIFHLSAERIRALPMKLLSLQRQRAIADFLDAETARIDALIAKKRRLIELLDEEQMSVVTDAVCGELTSTSQGPTDLPWLDSRDPEWREAKLSLLASLGTGHTPSREHPEWWVDCTTPWITTGEVAAMRSDRIEEIHETRESISDLGIANSSAVVHPAGTVVLSRTASAGYSAIMGRDMATSQDFVTWTCGPLLRPRFLLLCLRAMRQDLLGRLAMGSTHKTIYMPDVESLRVPLPPVATQDFIVENAWQRLRPLHRAIDRLGEQISLLTEHRQAIITAAVTGELEIPRAAA